MRLILDTHVAVWAIAASSRLSRRAVAMIEDGANDVAVSIVSLWEIAIKNALDRPASDSFGLTVAEAGAQFAAASFRLLPIDTASLSMIETLPLLHGDPFDRFLVAAAETSRAQLMTHDRRLAAYGDHVVIV